MHQSYKYFLGLLVAGCSFFYAEPSFAVTATVPSAVLQKSSLEISGWVPYWRKATGTREAIFHIDTFKEINPFGYTVKKNGDLFDAMKISEEPWLALITTARSKKIRVIPTVMWADTDAIHSILKNPKTRKAHIKGIVDMVKSQNFDGVDIDYEGKKAETRPYFSLFLKELYAAMGKKWVMCTIEARTPLSARYDTIPKDIEYANDYIAINKYCDRVRIMAYDQGAIDLSLNRAGFGPYVPIADPLWVEKSINEAIKTIAKKKIVIGIPTYGYEYEVKQLQQGYRYSRLWYFNQNYATSLAASLGMEPSRTRSGELALLYTPVATSTAISNERQDLSLSNNTGSASTTILGTISTSTNTPSVPPRILWWGDASSIKDKVALAKKLGVRGVAIFKIDGGMDQAMWDALK